MIAMMAQVGEVLDSRSRFSGDAFRFTLSDRVALGEAVVRRVGETPVGPAFITVSRFKFAEEIANEHSERAALFRSDEVRCALSAIDRAIQGEPLEGRDRLSVLQNLLVEMLAYLEKEEGFRTAYGERRKALVHLSEAHPLRRGDISVVHHIPGRIRLSVPELRVDERLASLLQARLQLLNHVRDVRINRNAASVVIVYSTDVSESEFLNALMKSLCEYEPAVQEKKSRKVLLR